MRPIFRKTVILALLVVMLIGLYSILAQNPPELGNVYASADGTFSFRYPIGWTLFTEEWYSPIGLWNGLPEENPMGSNAPDDFLVVSVYSPINIQEEVPEFIAAEPDYEQLMDDFFGETEAFSVEMEAVTVDDRPATLLQFETDEVEGQVLLLEMADGEVAMLVAFSAFGQYEQHQPTVEAMAASMQVHEYEEGELRPIVVNDLNVLFEMPAEFYAIPEDGAMIFGTARAIINDEAPRSGEMYAAIFSPEMLGIDEAAVEMSVETFEAVVNTLLGQDAGAIELSPPELTVYSDSVINAHIQATFMQDDLEGRIAMLELADGQIVFVYFSVMQGDLGDFEDVIGAIIDSIQPIDIDEAAIGNG